MLLEFISDDVTTDEVLKEIETMFHRQIALVTGQKLSRIAKCGPAGFKSTQGQYAISLFQFLNLEKVRGKLRVVDRLQTENHSSKVFNKKLKK